MQAHELVNHKTKIPKITDAKASKNYKPNTMIKTVILLITTIAISITGIAQEFNTEVKEDNRPTLLGKINKEALSQDSYGEWFTKNYEDFTPNTTATEQLKTALEGITITAFMGTWCGDSKAEVPKFYKVLETADFPLERMTMVGVSRERATYKQSPGGEEEGLNIHRVPTFIFYKDGKEINRIVEHPVNTIEEDMLTLLTGDYTNGYPAVSFVSEMLAELGIEKFNKKIKKISAKTKPLVNAKGDLNTYSYTLMAAGKEKESIAAAKLNTLLFPEDGYVYSSLGAKYKITGQDILAQEAFNKALVLDPKNEMALRNINSK